jgi:hypothetical protein
MPGLYEMFEELDEELWLILDYVSAIRELVENGQKKKALEALVELEEELEEFLTMPEDEEEGFDEDEEEEEGGSEDDAEN